MYYTNGENFDTLKQYSPTLYSKEWYRFVIEWRSDGTIISTLYDSNDNLVKEIRENDTRKTEGGICWTLNGNGSNTGYAIYDDAKILN
jgi:hypothetical protein